MDWISEKIGDGEAHVYPDDEAHSTSVMCCCDPRIDILAPGIRNAGAFLVVHQARIGIKRWMRRSFTDFLED